MTNHVLELYIRLGMTWVRIHACHLSGTEIGENISYGISILDIRRKLKFLKI